MQMILLCIYMQKQQSAALKLTTAMERITQWLDQSCVNLDVGQKHPPNVDILSKGERFAIVTEHKYLGVL